ncbi:Pro-Pol polyprotein [Phytophthora citrophthora]|uniref:Pro-Pol polyprotein n=1 Tax=Phytophthora citrophthora TaxID=4793 RepID=A0AAD9LQ40_9STRA|nr:Pro-Pol polyprotein [Phytophthora citrophthora]
MLSSVGCDLVSGIITAKKTHRLLWIFPHGRLLGLLLLEQHRTAVAEIWLINSTTTRLLRSWALQGLHRKQEQLVKVEELLNTCHFYISIGSNNKEFFSWFATSMEEPDDAMMPVSTGEMPIAVYPPLPPFSDRDLRLTEETTTRTAVLQGGETRRQVEALAHHSAAAHQRNAEQIGQVRLQQDRLAAQTSEYLQAQHDRQISLVEQQEEMRRQMDEHRKYLEEQYKILKAAEQAVGLQGQRLESLAEAVQPHLQARWGAFAQGAAPAASEQLPDVSTVTVATGTNLPVPPIYRGSSKKEKREFMDSYAIYSRRIKALNQGSQAKFFVMPLSACIEQGTMVRICGFELFKDEKDVTETEWRDYFLSARVPDNTAYKTLDREVKSLCVDTELQDAESRISRLMAEFYEIIDRLNMEDVVHTEPKKVVGYLVDALRPHSFKAAVRDQLSRQIHKTTKSNLASFLKWLRGELEDFMRFEAHISSHQLAKGNGKPIQQQDQAKRSAGGPQGGVKTNMAPEQQNKSNSKPKPKNSGDRPPKKCFKCGDQTHGVFQCPEVAGPAEAKTIYESTTGKKVLKPVFALAKPKNTTSRPSTTIPCAVMDTLETEITPDSAAEVSMVTTNLLNQLVAKGAWIKHQDIVGKAEVTGVGEKPVQVKSKVQLDLKFSTPGGPLVLRNVICWVTESKLPPGVGDLLLSRWIMERLGYSPEKLLAAAQQVRTEWDMSDVDDGPAGGIATILAYSGAGQTPVTTEEERALEEDEDRACFPDFLTGIDVEHNFVWPTMKGILEVQNGVTPPKDVTRSTEDLMLRDKDGRIWIPDEATGMQMRICVVGHFGIAGHRGMKVTLLQIKEKFVWTNMAKDVEFFVRRCLHCASTLGGPPQLRPLGEAMHAEKPNELIHWDYLFMEKSDTNLEYVLVIKDDASKYVWLIPSMAADADTTFTALLDWFAPFGVCRSWVSDQGTHFKNAVIQAMQHTLGAHHHFTTARCPWANGTVEVVMRETLRCCRALLSEWRLQPSEWPRVIKIVQLVLNNTPSPLLGGVAPVTAMTGLHAMSPSDHIAIPGPVEMATLSDIQTAQRANVVRLQRALEIMHKHTTAINSAVRAGGRKGHDKKKGTKMAQFDIGDFVLYADVWNHTRSKLRVNWCGPAQVMATVSNWIFEIRNLVTGQQKEVHASRLKFYSDSSLDVSEDLMLHIAHNSEGHVVDALLEARYNSMEKRHELKVHWRGLDSIEDSWEPAATLMQDVPAAVKSFVRANSNLVEVKALRKALQLD